MGVYFRIQFHLTLLCPLQYIAEGTDIRLLVEDFEEGPAGSQILVSYHLKKTLQDPKLLVCYHLWNNQQDFKMLFSYCLYRPCMTSDCWLAAISIRPAGCQIAG